MDSWFQEIAGGLIVAAITWWAAITWKELQNRRRNTYSKFTYFRVIRLRFKSRGDAPYYERSHHTLERAKEPVFDECWVLNGVQCNRAIDLGSIQFTSSGMVDALQIHPRLNRDMDNHPHTGSVPSKFECWSPRPTDRITAVGTVVNGLQDPGEWWFGTTAQYDGQTLVLVVDFSSLPFDTKPIREISTALERDRHNVNKESVSRDWFQEIVGGDIVYVRFENAKKKDTVKVLFDIDANDVPKKGQRRRRAEM